MSYVLLVVLGGALFVGILGFCVYRYQRTRRCWREFADSHGLEFDSGPVARGGGIRMSGDYRGERVEMHTVLRGSRFHRMNSTVFSVVLPPSVPMDLVMYDEKLFSRVGTLFGGEDIEVGRPEFDEAFVIKGGHPHEIREFLDRDVVADALLDLYDLCGNLHLEHQSLRLDQEGVIDDPDEIEAHFEGLVRCAKVLKNAGEANAIGTMETYESESTPTPQSPSIGEDAVSER